MSRLIKETLSACLHSHYVLKSSEIFDKREHGILAIAELATADPQESMIPQSFGEGDFVPHPEVGIQIAEHFSGKCDKASKLPFEAQACFFEEQRIGLGISFVDPRDVFARAPLQIRHHQSKDTVFPEHAVSIFERLVEILKGEMFQHVAGVDTLAALIRNGQALYDIPNFYVIGISL